MVATEFMLYSLGLLVAVAAPYSIAEGQLNTTHERVRPVDTLSKDGRMLSGEELASIGKQCPIGIWQNGDTLILQGVYSMGQDKKFRRRLNCASRLIERQGFKGAILVG